MPTIAQAFAKAKEQWATAGRYLASGEVLEGLAHGRYGLKTDTGNLANRVSSKLLPAKNGFVIGTSVNYGRGWELGFTRSAFEIRPKRAKALRFEYQGSIVFAKRARIPAKSFPARPWLEPAIKAKMPELTKTANQVFQMALDQSFPDRKIYI